MINQTTTYDDIIKYVDKFENELDGISYLVKRLMKTSKKFLQMHTVQDKMTFDERHRLKVSAMSFSYIQYQIEDILCFLENDEIKIAYEVLSNAKENEFALTQIASSLWRDLLEKNLVSNEVSEKSDLSLREQVIKNIHDGDTL